MDKENKLILYQDEEGIVKVNVRFADEDVWFTQQQLAEIYCTTKQNVSQHIDNILTDGELEGNRTVKNFLTVRQEGKRQVRRDITYYNLDIIIALGYRVQSPIAVRFRRWATQRLHEYIQKGFTMDDERVKQGGKPQVQDTLPVLLFLHGEKGDKCLIIDKIAWIEADRSYVHFHMKDGRKEIARCSLKNVLQQLNDRGIDFFVRIHNSYATNIYHIERKMGHNIYVGNDILMVSRRYREGFSKRYIDIKSTP